MKTATISLALVTLASLATAASAVPFMDVNFDGDAAGSMPSTGAVTNPLVKPTAIGGYTATTADSPPTAANGTMVVGDVGGMSKAAILTTNPANNILGALWIDNNGFAQTSQSITISFDVNILSAPTASLTQPKLVNGGPATAGIVLGMNTFLNSGDIGARFAAAPTSANGGVFAIRTADNSSLQTFFNYVEGETYNVKLVSDYNAGVVSTYVDGVFMGDRAFATGAFAGATTGEFFFHLNGDLLSENSVALDNIVASVPEPAMLGVLGAASVLGLRRRRS